MHSFHGKVNNFHFNSDFSGEVVINNKADLEFRVNAQDIIDFVRKKYLSTEVNGTIDHYKTKFERKQRLIEPYRKKFNNDEHMTEKEYADYKVLEAEINMLKRFIEELEYIIE